MTVPSEDEVRRSVEDFASGTKKKPGLGWLSFHPPNCKTQSGRWSSGSITGWPDTTFVRPPRIVYIEFKGVTAPFTDKQRETLNALLACDVEVFRWHVREVTLTEMCSYLIPWKRPECPWTDPAIVGPWPITGAVDLATARAPRARRTP